MSTNESPPPRSRRRTAFVAAALAAGFSLLVAVWALVAERCSNAVTNTVDGLDALRTDKTWRDAYRGLTAMDAGALLASLRALDDPRLHPRMGRGVVVRGCVDHVEVPGIAGPEDPVVVLEAPPGSVRCRFDASRLERVRSLVRGRVIVVGGALLGMIEGDAELMACHFEDEWTAR